MTGNSFGLHSHEDHAGREYFYHSSAQRTNTNVVLVEALRKQYPHLSLVVAPQAYLNLLAYASAGNAIATPLQDQVTDPIYGAALTIRSYVPPARRLGNQPGVMVEQVLFGKYMYKWKGHEFLLYIANGRDGSQAYPDITYHYILSNETHKVDELIKEATLWGAQLHNEVWVFDQGYWQKSRELWEAVQKSRWEDVILEESMKKAIIADVENFFDGQETYTKLKVPWKRGIIYHGPPGNGKTISIKAMMHSLYQRGQSNSKLTVPTLYVRTLTSFAGPEYSLRSIFTKAREAAPCYLVFEDLDSIVNDHVRSYFLNEVDGLKSNDGILMVGSTNHLDRLDPGISKRPSRFDRKYFFPDPDYDQRVAYAKFWQGKLKDNHDLEFPDELCPAVANITDKFSFAYMQEAFVASLLAIATRKDGENLSNRFEHSGYQDPVWEAAAMPCNGGEKPDGDLDKLTLWKELQLQVKILRDEMENKSGNEVASGIKNSTYTANFTSTQPPKLGTVSSQTRKPDSAKNRESYIPEGWPLAPRLAQQTGGKPAERTTTNRSLFSEFEVWKAERMRTTAAQPSPLRDTIEEQTRRPAQKMAQLGADIDSLSIRERGYDLPTPNSYIAPKASANLNSPSERKTVADFYSSDTKATMGPKVKLNIRPNKQPDSEEDKTTHVKSGLANWKPRAGPWEGMSELPAPPPHTSVIFDKGLRANMPPPPQLPTDHNRFGILPPDNPSNMYPPLASMQAPLGERVSPEAGRMPVFFSVPGQNGYDRWQHRPARYSPEPSVPVNPPTVAPQRRPMAAFVEDSDEDQERHVPRNLWNPRPERRG